MWGNRLGCRGTGRLGGKRDACPTRGDVGQPSRLPGNDVIMYTPHEGHQMADETFHRRRLPHWERQQAAYFITACLAGSIPASGLLAIRRSVELAAGRAPSSAATMRGWRQARDRIAFARRDDWLDRAASVRWFSDRRLAEVAADAIRHHAGSRYALHAYVVMPSHIHCVLSPLRASAGNGRMTSVGAIMHSLKSFIAHECTKIRDSSGPFWQHESYDRVVRNEKELERIVTYVEWNPVKAGLCARPSDWRFSSAFPNAQAVR
jgi:putative transposase